MSAVNRLSSDLFCCSCLEKQKERLMIFFLYASFLLCPDLQKRKNRSSPVFLPRGKYAQHLDSTNRWKTLTESAQLWGDVLNKETKTDLLYMIIMFCSLNPLTCRKKRGLKPIHFFSAAGGAPVTIGLSPGESCSWAQTDPPLPSPEGRAAPCQGLPGGLHAAGPWVSLGLECYRCTQAPGFLSG